MAFESPTTRSAWYAADAVSKYSAVQINSDGQYEPADGTGTFIGIAEYGCEAADEMITVVQGIFPAIAGAAVPAGSKVTVDAAHPGKLIVAVGEAVVYGIALDAAADADELFSVHMLPASAV